MEKRKTLFTIKCISPLTTIAFCALLYAKCYTEQGATLPWFWVFSPFWIPLALVVGFFLIFYGFAAICFVVGYGILGLVSLLEWIGRKFKRGN